MREEGRALGEALPSRTSSGEATSRRSPVGPRAALRLVVLRFLVIGSSSFGGGIVAYLRDLLVDRTGWMSADEFMAVLEMGQILPGLNAANIAVLAGDRLRGWMGALAALLALIAPGAAIVFVLGVAASDPGPLVGAALRGVAAGSVGLLLSVMLKVGRGQFRHAPDVALVLFTFLLFGVFRVPLPVVLIVCAPLGIWLHRPGAAHPPEIHQSDRLVRLHHRSADRA